MYLPKHFAETRVEVMHELMRARPLATLVTLGSEGLVANHIPLIVSADPPPFGTLRGHVARSNPIWRDYSAEVEALAVFHGPDAYVTPSWYPAKRETGQVVPTWNYATVHASGRLRIVHDADWLRTLLDELTNQQEREFAAPWKVADAPAEFIQKLLGAIVGIELVITKLTGKWKVSQNQNEANRAGVVDGLRARNQADASLIADLIEADLIEQDAE